MKNISFGSLFIIIIAMIVMPVFIYHQIDYHFINPVNQDKMPNSFLDLKNEVQENMDNLTEGLPNPIDKWSYYKPSVNSVSEFRRFNYNDRSLSIISSNVSKHDSVQRLKNEDSDTIISYCDYNIHTIIKKSDINNQEFIDIYVEFEDRGVCMY